MKQKYYNIENLLKQKAEYNILLGERSNGKSYAVKYMCLWEAYHKADYLTKKPKARYQLGYIRRWREEIKGRDVVQYFEDMPIRDITNGEYDGIQCYRGDIYFCSHDEDGTEIRGEKIGACFALTGVTHYKSLAFPTIGNCIFEEFITNQGYLPHEVDNLQSLISTIARRDRVSVFMIGNTISRLCPYFDEWSLTHVKKQKQGTIDIYKQATNQIDDAGKQVVITIAVEYCENSGNNSRMFFGDKSKMITSGVWESEVYPHLEKPYNHYKVHYKVYYEYTSFRFIITLLTDGDNMPFLYVYPAKDRGKIKRAVTDKYTNDKFTTLYLTKVAKYDTIIMDLLDNKKIVFSDNLTGTEFYQIKKERGRF